MPHRRMKPWRIVSSGSSTNSHRPVMWALPSTSGITARWGPKVCVLDDAAREPAADETLDDDGFTDIDLTASTVDGQPRADTGTGRGAVDLAVGEDADVSAVDP